MVELKDTLVFFVPVPETERVLDAVFAAGAGSGGGYDRCAFVSAGEGRYRPLSGSSPAIGAVGEDVRVKEDRVEVTLPRARREAVVAALLKAHPYEQPAWSMFENVGVR